MPDSPSEELVADQPPENTPETDPVAASTAAPESAPQTTPETVPGTVPEQAPAAAPSTTQRDTGTLNGSEGSPIRNTIPLSEAAAPPVPPLSEKDVLEDRYRIVSFLGTAHATNIYRVQDLQGYRRCWACGSTASVEGETYCVDCGAQLTGRHYRLQEFNMPQGVDTTELGDVALALLPQPILENQVPGVAHVYDALTDPPVNRAYIVWEEVYGRALSAWVPGVDTASALVSLAPPTSSGLLPSMDEPEEEQAIFWMAQATDILAQLHAHGITGCSVTLDNIVVQPGDRLALIDPDGCRQPDEPAMADSQLADVRALAAQLETWYMAVREEAIPQMVAQQAQAMMPQVDEVTGPLNSASNPSVLISKAKEGVYSTAAELAQALYSLYEANKPLNNLILWSGRASDIGRVRQINEDSLLTIEATVLEHEDSTPIGLYVIADGMGGHQSGEVASSIAARTIGAVVNSALIAPMVEGDPANINAAGLASLLQSAVLEANRRISELARERRSDLGTTVTAAIVLGNQLTVANVGDSRTYLMRDGQLGVITRDHSLVAQLVAAGQLAPDDIYTHPRRNEIYRALGDSHLTDAEVDVFSQRLQPGDAILLCSDGLWDFVRDPVIKGIISDTARKDPQTACNALIDQANTMGGEDNISTILVRVLQMQEEE